MKITNDNFITVSELLNTVELQGLHKREFIVNIKYTTIILVAQYKSTILIGRFQEIADFLVILGQDGNILYQITIVVAVDFQAP